MEVIKTSQKSSLFKRILAGQLILALAWPSAGFVYAAGPTPLGATGDVSVQGESVALQNLGRAVQSPDARSTNLPSRNAPQIQPSFELPDMGDPGGGSLRRMGGEKEGEGGGNGGQMRENEGEWGVNGRKMGARTRAVAQDAGQGSVPKGQHDGQQPTHGMSLVVDHPIEAEYYIRFVRTFLPAILLV